MNILEGAILILSDPSKGLRSDKLVIFKSPEGKLEVREWSNGCYKFIGNFSYDEITSKYGDIDFELATIIDVEI